MSRQESKLEPSSSKASNVSAIAALCIAVLSIASAAIFIKLCEREIGPYATAFNRFWLASLALGTWSGFKTTRRPEVIASFQSSVYTGAIIGQLLLVGILLSADLSLWAWSITQTTIANATLLANLTPLFTCLAGWLIWNRQVEQHLLVGIIVAISGILVIGFDDFQLTTGKLQGDIAALLAAVSFSIYLLLLEQLQSQLKSTTIVLWSSLVAMFLTFPIALIEQGPLFPISWQGWLTLVSMTLICQVLGQSLLVHSLEHFSAEIVAVILLLDPVLATLAGWAFFSEQLSVLNFIGFAIVLIGVFLGLNNPLKL